MASPTVEGRRDSSQAPLVEFPEMATAAKVLRTRPLNAGSRAVLENSTRTPSSSHQVAPAFGISPARPSGSAPRHQRLMLRAQHLRRLTAPGGAPKSCTLLVLERLPPACAHLACTGRPTGSYAATRLGGLTVRRSPARLNRYPAHGFMLLAAQY